MARKLGDVTCPDREVIERLCTSERSEDQALYVAILSLEQIAGLDSPEGGSERADALRNFGRVTRLLELAPEC